MIKTYFYQCTQMEAYQSVLPKMLKEFESTYNFWAIAAPVEYRASWKQLADYATFLKGGGKPGDFHHLLSNLNEQKPLS